MQIQQPIPPDKNKKDNNGIMKLGIVLNESVGYSVDDLFNYVTENLVGYNLCNI